MAADDVVVDVGANIGLWCLGAALRASRVVAFEPVPSSLERLRRNVALNDATVAIESVALGATRGPQTIFEAAHGNSGGSGFLRRPGITGALEVDVDTLDRPLALHAIDAVDFLKIDVEGAEPLVLDGAKSLLARDDAPIVLLEVNQPALEGMGFSAEAITRPLEQLGFSLFEPIAGRLLPFSTSASADVVDLLAIKPRRLSLADLLLAGRGDDQGRSPV